MSLPDTFDYKQTCSINLICIYVEQSCSGVISVTSFDNAALESDTVTTLNCNRSCSQEILFFLFQVSIAASLLWLILYNVVTTTYCDDKKKIILVWGKINIACLFKVYSMFKLIKINTLIYLPFLFVWTYKLYFKIDSTYFIYKADNEFIYY